MIDRTKSERWFLLISSFALFLLAFFPYSNNLHNDFVFDDVSIVEENDRIKSMGNLSEIFASDYWGSHGGEATGLYRPLTLLTFAVNYHFSKLDPFAYHLTNNLVHSLNAVLIFFLFFVIFKDMSGAFFAAAIFAIHPVHTEAVTGIVGRAELLAFFFVIVSLILFISALSKKAAETASFFIILAALLSFLLGLLSKETAIALPLILVFILIYMEKQAGNRTVWQSLFMHRWLLLAIASVCAVYFLVRSIVFGDPLGSFTPLFLDNPLAHLSLIRRWLGASIVFLKYLWLLVFPLYLSADYSYNQVPVSGFIPSVIGTCAFCILLVIIAMAVLLYRKKSDFFIPLSFYLSAMLIISNFLIVTGTIMAERILYLPSAAFCIFLGLLFSMEKGPILKSKNGKIWFYLILVIIAVFAIPRTLYRNHDWKNERRLFESTVLTSPMSAKAHNNLGNLYLKTGDFTDAEREIRTALTIYPDYSVALNNLGTIFESRGLLDEAIEHYRTSIKIDPGYEVAYSNLGNALFKRGDFDEAVVMYRQAISIDPRYADAFYNLGTALALLKRFDGAVYHYTRTLEIEPEYVEAANNLGMVLRLLGRSKEAESAFLRALKIAPSFHGSLFNLGRLYAEEGRYDEAIRYLETARRQNEKHFGTLFYLGLAYARIGDMEKGYEILKKAEVLEPKNAELLRLLHEIEEERTR